MLRLRTRLMPGFLLLLWVSQLWLPLVLPAQAAPQSATGERPLLVGYFPQWGLYNEPQYLMRDLVAGNGAAILSQVNYAQAFVTGGRCSVADPHADLDLAYTAAQSVDGVADAPAQVLRGGFNQVRKFKRMYPQLKVVISLEGRASDFAFDALPENRMAFVTSCVKLFLAGKLRDGIDAGPLFDGIDVDWEYPGIEHREDFFALLAEFRRQMDTVGSGKLLTIAVGPNPAMAGGIDLTQLGGLVDQVGLMTYDMSGPWSARTGFHAPLRLAEGQPGGTGQRAIEAFIAAGIPANKLLLGVPFYGYGWRKVEDQQNGLFQEGEGMRGDHPYREISGMASGSQVYRDEASQTPWLFDGDVFWTYDDPVSVRYKADYVRKQRLGGVMVWELGEDTQEGDLLRAAYEGLGGEVPAVTKGQGVGGR